MKCKDCKFWGKYFGSEGKGQCRRHAPDVIVTGGGLIIFSVMTAETKFPETTIDDWCGEFEAKIEKENP